MQSTSSVERPIQWGPLSAADGARVRTLALHKRDGEQHYIGVWRAVRRAASHLSVSAADSIIAIEPESQTLSEACVSDSWSTERQRTTMEKFLELFEQDGGETCTEELRQFCNTLPARKTEVPASFRGVLHRAATAPPANACAAAGARALLSSSEDEIVTDATKLLAVHAANGCCEIQLGVQRRVGARKTRQLRKVEDAAVQAVGNVRQVVAVLQAGRPALGCIIGEVGNAAVEKVLEALALAVGAIHMQRSKLL